MKIIKKYKNRRLYDSDKSAYITFDEIKQYIQDEVDFEVRDSKTDEDLTNNTLLQVLVETDSKRSELIPKALIIQLIKAQDNPMSQAMTDMLEKTLKLFNQNPNELTGFNQIMDDWSKNTQAAVAQWQDIFFKQADKEKNEA